MAGAWWQQWDQMRLVTMLGLLTAIVLAALLYGYFKPRQGRRLGLALALLGVVVGTIITVNAVRPESNFYGPVVSYAGTSQKVVALTFDDGPYPPYTDKILDALQQYQVRATFFVIGQNVDKYPALVRREVTQGHEVGNHTYHHYDLLKMGRGNISREIDLGSAAIARATGRPPTLLRPPHGFRDPAVMEAAEVRHLTVVEWSVMSRDWTNPGVDAIVMRTLAHVHNGSVILLHDGDGTAQRASREQTVAATRLIVAALQQQGYKFVTVSELAHMGMRVRRP